MDTGGYSWYEMFLNVLELVEIIVLGAMLVTCHGVSPVYSLVPLVRKKVMYPVGTLGYSWVQSLNKPL